MFGKKNLYFGFVAVFFAILAIAPTMAFAKDSTSNIPYVKVSYGFVAVPDSDIVRHIPRFNLDIPGTAKFGGGNNWSGALGVMFGATNIAAELEMNVGSFPLESVTLNDFTLEAQGTIRQIGAMLNIFYRIPIGNSGKFVPYVGVGVGGVITNTFKPRFGDEDLDDEAKGRFMHQFMVGAEYRLNRHWSVFGEGKIRKTPTIRFNTIDATYKARIISFGIKFSM